MIHFKKKTMFLCSLLALLIVSFVYAIDLPFTKHPIETNFDGAYAIMAADIDEDDDLDIVGTAYLGQEIAWWENNSEGQSEVTWTKHIVGQNFNGVQSVYVADIDQDNDLDILGAAFIDNEISWWENSVGDGSSWTKHIVNQNFVNASSVYAADIDNDNDLDILGTALGDDEITWWENSVGNGSTWVEHLVDAFDGAGASHAADVDQDGDLDILASAYFASSISWWENSNGDGSVWTKRVIDGSFAEATDVYAGDIDRDGDLDILGAALSGYIIWWENAIGNGTAWTEHTVDNTFDGAYSVYAADMNRDGYLDIIAASANSNSIAWWENITGEGSSWTKQIIDGEFRSTRAIYAADIDGDSDMDILGSAFQDDEITWWESEITPLPTHTPTVIPTHTPTTVPFDTYEPNDSCEQANAISTDGTLQMQGFEERVKQADQDWVVFEATADTSYLIEARIPPDSTADVILELYNVCDEEPTVPVDGQGYTFSPDIRLEFTASASGPLYLKLLNNNPEIAGPTVTYHLSIRELEDEPQPGALVLVAGRLRLNDPLEENIFHVTDTAYNIFQQQGYDDDRIYYLAPDTEHPNVDALASLNNLQAAITQWAVEHVGPDGAFTLYIMDHGYVDTLYLDQPRGERVTPAQIDTWLNELEAARPGVRINVILEACYSGSFIDPQQELSAPGRVVITSTGAQQLAWASDQGATFSDHFLAALQQGQSLYQSFQNARWATEEAHPAQTPLLEDEGNAQANQSSDGLEAARRGFAFAGTLGPGDQLWSPYIVQGDVPTGISNAEGQIWAEVRDNEGVRRVWAVIYPPSYQPPTEGEELVQEQDVVPTLLLINQGNDEYAATFTGFNEIGSYRIVIYAEDDNGLEGRPFSFLVQTGHQLYLPTIIR